MFSAPCPLLKEIYDFFIRENICEDDKQLLIFHNPFPPNVVQISDRINSLATSLFPTISLNYELIRFYIHRLTITSKAVVIKNIFKSPSLQNNQLRGLISTTGTGAVKRFLVFMNLVIGIGGTKKVFWAIDIDNVEGKCGRGKVALVAKDLEKTQSFRSEWVIHEFFRQKILQENSLCLFDLGAPKLSPKETFSEETQSADVNKTLTICFSDNKGERLQTIDYYESVDIVVKIFTDVANALALIHRIRFAHNDIKPGNILVANGKSSIIDLGLARPFGVESACSKIVAPPFYEGDFKYKSDPLADIWALGACLFMCLSRQNKILSSKEWSCLMSKSPSELSQTVLESFIKSHVADPLQCSVIFKILRINKDERPSAVMLPEIFGSLLHS